jgi:hypothetical protein
MSASGSKADIGQLSEMSAFDFANPAASWQVRRLAIGSLFKF